jgi:hypothetical protein
MAGFSWTVMCVAAVLTAVQTGESATRSENVAKVRALLEALNSQDEAKIAAFLETALSAKAGGATPMSERAAKLAAFAKQGASFTLGQILSDTPTDITVRIAGRANMDLEMKLEFELEEPHGITSVRIGGPGSQSGPPPKRYKDWKGLPELLSQIKSDTRSAVENPLRRAAYKGGKRTSNCAIYP